jgi:rhodanese-related sulfurtransferase
MNLTVRCFWSIFYNNIKKMGAIILIMLISLASSFALGYDNIQPSEVHEKLVNGDTLIIVDVREWTEYIEGHIAEPEGQLPLTPALFPWSSGVLVNEYDRLPRDIDLIVHCRSGGRSAQASAFLESKGFTRIFNMVTGFKGGWENEYESRDKGYGDHSGKWYYPDDPDTTIISVPDSIGLSRITITPMALTGADSYYVEIHPASDRKPIPAGSPVSDVKGLFRITLLDPFGLTVFKADSLALADTVHLSLSPEYGSPGGQPLSLINENLTAHILGSGWIPIDFNLENGYFQRGETVLRKWYNIEGSIETAVLSAFHEGSSDFKVFPNPSNGVFHILSPVNAEINVYDLTGRFIEKLKHNRWMPDHRIPSGVYLLQMRLSRRTLVRRITYLK